MTTPRRWVPWALVATVPLSMGLGAGLGLAFQPGTEGFLERVVASTEDAGTAAFSFTSITTGTEAFSNSTSHGSGVVDFTRDAIRSETFEEIQGAVATRVVQSVSAFEQIEIGRRSYTRPVGPDGPVAALTSVSVGNGRVRSGPIGLVFGAAGLLVAGGGRPATAERIGAGRVGGVATTEYVVRSNVCDRGGESVGPIELWVDGQDRLVQARDSVRYSLPSGTTPIRESILTTVRIDRFGSPVRIVAPSTRTADHIAYPAATTAASGTTSECTAPHWVAYAG